MRFFNPSSEPHVWRQAFALFALSVWTMFVLAWLIIHGANLLGPIHWNFGPPALS